MRFIYPTWEGASALRTSFVRWERSDTLFRAAIAYSCVHAEKGWEPPLSFRLSVWRFHGQLATWAPWFKSLHVSDRQSNPDLSYGIYIGWDQSLIQPTRRALVTSLFWGWRTLRIEITGDRRKKAQPYAGYRRH